MYVPMPLERLKQGIVQNQVNKFCPENPADDDSGISLTLQATVISLDVFVLFLLF